MARELDQRELARLARRPDPDERAQRAALLARWIARLSPEIDRALGAALAAGRLAGAGERLQGELSRRAGALEALQLAPWEQDFAPIQEAAVRLIVAARLGPSVRAGCPGCGARMVRSDDELSPNLMGRIEGDPLSPLRLKLAWLTEGGPEGPQPGASLLATQGLWDPVPPLWTWLSCPCGASGWLPGFVCPTDAGGPHVGVHEWAARTWHRPRR